MKVEFNPSVERVLTASAKKILFVHVGKCAGESIIHALRSHLPDDFILFEMHVYDANARIEAIVEAAPLDLVYVIAARDPVDRYISAFNWDKHNLYLKGSLKNTEWETLFERFPDVESLISGLRNEDPAVQALANKFSRFGHMGMGQSWYTPSAVFERLPANRTFFVDVVSMKRDLLHVFAVLGYPQDVSTFVPPKMKVGFHESYSNHDKMFPTFLSGMNRAFLVEHIADDVVLYGQIRAAAEREFIKKAVEKTDVEGHLGQKTNVVPDPYAAADKWAELFWDSNSHFKNFFDRLPKGNVVDLGCGHGRHAKHAAPLCKNLILVDVLQENIDFCKSRFVGFENMSYVLGNGNSFPLADQSVDSIYCYDTMVSFGPELVERYIIDTERVLTRGGMAVYHHSNRKGRPANSTAENLHSRSLMSKDEFANLALQAGLEVLDQRVFAWGGVADLDCISLLKKP